MLEQLLSNENGTTWHSRRLAETCAWRQNLPRVNTRCREPIVYSALYNDCDINWKICVTTFSINVNVSRRENDITYAESGYTVMKYTYMEISGAELSISEFNVQNEFVYFALQTVRFFNNANSFFYWFISKHFNTIYKIQKVQIFNVYQISRFLIITLGKTFTNLRAIIESEKTVDINNTVLQCTAEK